MDPGDFLKFDIKRNNQYVLAKSVVFGWVYGTVSFQLISDAIGYLMRDQVKLHCYIKSIWIKNSKKTLLGFSKFYPVLTL